MINVMKTFVVAQAYWFTRTSCGGLFRVFES